MNFAKNNIFFFNKKKGGYFFVVQVILFRHEFHEFSRSNCLHFVKIREIRV
jgi:hypothetical protein